MARKLIEDRYLNRNEVDEGLLVLASMAAEKLGIPLPLFVNQALQEKLLRHIDERPATQGGDRGDESEI